MCLCVVGWLVGRWLVGSVGLLGVSSHGHLPLYRRLVGPYSYKILAVSELQDLGPSHGLVGLLL